MRHRDRDDQAGRRAAALLQQGDGEPVLAGRGPLRPGRGGPSALRTARAWADGKQLFLDIRELGT
jgi:hypothetical protein